MTSSQFNTLLAAFEKHCEDTEGRLRRLERWMWVGNGGIAVLIFLIQQGRVQF